MNPSSPAPTTGLGQCIHHRAPYALPIPILSLIPPLRLGFACRKEPFKTLPGANRVPSHCLFSNRVKLVVKPALNVKEAEQRLPRRSQRLNSASEFAEDPTLRLILLPLSVFNTIEKREVRKNLIDLMSSRPIWRISSSRCGILAYP